MLLDRSFNPQIMKSPSSYIEQFPIVHKKIQCPLCLQNFNIREGMSPRIVCKSSHTVCNKCISAMIQKCNQQKIAIKCPLCRQQLTNLHFQLNNQYNEISKYINLKDNIIKQTKRQALDKQRKYQQYMYKNFKQSKQIDSLTKQIGQLKKKISQLQLCNQVMKMEFNQYKQKNRNRQKNLNIELETQQQSQQNQQKKHKQINQKAMFFGKDQTKKAPLSWFCDDMPNDYQLLIAKRNYTKTQIQYLVMYDMSKLRQINLSFNQIGNDGLITLCEQAQLPGLRTIKLCNNQITQIPDCIKALNHIQEFDLSNHQYPPKQHANIFNQESFNTFLNTKWTKLKNWSIEFQNDKIWESQENLTKIVEQLTVISRITLSQMITKITKVKCSGISTKLTQFGKRSSRNKIKVINI